MEESKKEKGNKIDKIKKGYKREMNEMFQEILRTDGNQASLETSGNQR